jgi:hypothetical protein
LIKIARDFFADHYSQNREVQPAEITIDKDSNFIMQRRLVFTETEILNELLNKTKMREAIT